MIFDGAYSWPDFPTAGIKSMAARVLFEATTLAAPQSMFGLVVLLKEYRQGWWSASRSIIHELPYQLNKARLIREIAELVKEKRSKALRTA